MRANGVQEPSTAHPSLRAKFLHLAGKLEDGAMLRVTFFAMLTGTLGMLWIDYRELPTQTDQVVAMPVFDPILPSVERPEIDPDNPAFRPQEKITTDQSVLRQPLEISLQPDGVLRLEGTIAPGSAEAFANEIAQRGEYVEIISLNSPGGSVADALAIGRLIREKELTTSVAAGGFCASSCPLILAGGIGRLANAASVIGIHQVYVSENNRLDAAQILSDAQSTTAEITRYLSDMTIDPALWLHALETPPDKLYYLTSEELKTFKLATKISK